VIRISKLTQEAEVSRKLKERIETRSSEENKRSACEDFECEIEDLCVHLYGDIGSVIGRFYV
jgi:hypothetical protein